MRRYPDRRYYQRIATASGYPVAPLERVFRLAALLGELVARLPGELLLRAGTALNLLHLDAPRLSVDLDVDHIGSADAEQARTRRPGLLVDLEESGSATRSSSAVPRPPSAGPMRSAPTPTPRMPPTGSRRSVR
jgi:hypothetical protein